MTAFLIYWSPQQGTHPCYANVPLFQFLGPSPKDIACTSVKQECFFARITISVLLVSLIVFQHTDAWRRRRRRQCSPVACKVSYWSPWSSCNAYKCGQQGSRHRTRTELSPSACGGAACPQLTETIPCSSTKKVDCLVSPWSKWSACTTPCGVSSSRHRIIIEQCGGTCVLTFQKTRACPELKCLNGGSLKKGTCFCKESFGGSCCEKGK